MKRLKSAFTLAEVLITMVIIGIVAAITMPMLLSEVSERVNSNRQANIVQKVTKAVELMIVNGDYTGFQTTDEFVDKLQKYLKVAKRCDSNHLADCWPSRYITNSEGEKKEVSAMKTGIELHTINNTNNVGLVLADGASIILTFNPNAPLITAENGFKQDKKRLPIGNKKFKDFAYTSNATSAIDFVMDVNGSTGPNAETDKNENYFDIRSFKTASFSKAGCPGYKVSGICVYDLGTDYEPALGNSCLSYWKGAKEACSKLNMSLPDRNQMKQLVDLNDERLPDLKNYYTTYAASTPECDANYGAYNYDASKVLSKISVQPALCVSY